MGPAGPETYPRTPRALERARVGALVIAAAALALAARTTFTSTAWIGRVFPGFVLLDNRVVASVTLAHWSGATTPGLFQSELLAVDGVPVASSAEAYARVAALAPGTPVRYRLWHDGVDRELTLATQRFGLRDWLFIFGAYLVNGLVSLGSGLVVWTLRPRATVTRTFLAWTATVALFLLTAMDLYGPAALFRVHAAAEPLIPAIVLAMALLFPHRHPWARWAVAGYAVSLALAVLYQVVLYQPAAYVRMLDVNMAYMGCAGAAFAVRLVLEYWRGRSELARQRVRVITLGTLFGIAFPGAVALVSALSPGGMAMNLAAMTPFLFALSLAYALVKQDLFEIDAMVKRGAYYLLLTGAVGAAYVGAVVVFNLTLQAGPVADSPAFPLLFTLAVLLLFNPLRTRLQGFVDRGFFRTRYDGPQVLGQVGRELAGALKREQIAHVVRECVDTALPNTGSRLFVAGAEGAGPREVGGTVEVPPVLLPYLARGRVLTAFDPGEVYADGASHEVAHGALAGLGAEIAVPLQLRGSLVGVLTTGPKRSGLLYNAGDVQLLRALAHQVAIALENARTYEALAELNARLEERVRERTAQLEATNRDLAEAYAELKNAEVQLVHSEKMASLGRLVAGVAHEINNPVSFIATSVAPLRRRIAEAAAEVPPEVMPLLHEAEDIVGIMARGAERTAGIVKDLRSFSRLGEATRKPVDLRDGLEVSLRLLEPRWRGRITVHRDYGEVPPIECAPGPMSQVFMNLLANACDAIVAQGNIWITTRQDGDEVTITIRDDGVGITAETASRIFEPFFTTKDVGGGTGLGLAISHSVVSAHGGRITLESRPGAGSTFRIVLPAGTAGGVVPSSDAVQARNPAAARRS